MKNLFLSNGTKIPQIGFGTADIEIDSEDATEQAIRAGYRLIDTARIYGSEAGIGKAIKKCISAGICTRDELFIQTKLDPAKHSYDGAIESFNESIDTLGLSYVDQFLIHWPVPRGAENDYFMRNIEVWKAFEDLYKHNKTRAIGVSNFLERHCIDILDNCKISPMTNQIEIHPAYQQCGLVRFCRNKGMLIQAWSPMGRGLLQTQEWLSVAKKYNKNTGQILLRWSIEHEFIPLPRSSNTGRISSNIKIFDFKLDSIDVEKLDNMNTCDQYVDIWSYKRQMMY